MGALNNWFELAGLTTNQAPTFEHTMQAVVGAWQPFCVNITTKYRVKQHVCLFSPGASSQPTHRVQAVQLTREAHHDELKAIRDKMTVKVGRF